MNTTYSNCWLWAVKKYLSDQGYIAFRKSNYGWWCHAFWSPDGETWYHFAPEEPEKRRFPPIFYTGIIKKGID